jgi:acyl-CoA thioesterase
MPTNSCASWTSRRLPLAGSSVRHTVTLPANVAEGGQLLGEAIVAASKTVPGQWVTSAYMIFSKVVAFDEPVELHTEVLRGGRTFSNLHAALRRPGDRDDWWSDQRYRLSSSG